MPYWQDIVAVLIVAAALAYLLRWVFGRRRRFSGAGSPCEGCPGSGSNATSRRPLVQISRQD